MQSKSEISKFKAYIMASRPLTLWAGIGPVILGNIVGLYSNGGHVFNYSRFDLMIFLGSLLAVAFLQISANLVNDVKDAEKGVDKADRVGPPRAIQKGWLTVKEVKTAYRFCFALAVIIGSLLSLKGGFIVILLGCIGLLFAYAYTAGPFPLSYFGLGELLAFIFFGPLVVAGCSYLQTLEWEVLPFLVGAGPGFLASALMAINNFRDRDSDKRAGKFTLAVYFGPKMAFLLPFLFVVLGVFVLVGTTFVFWGLLASLIYLFISIIIAAIWIFPFLIKGGAFLNVALKKTSSFIMIYSIIFVSLFLFYNF